jgi:hypothetical protein
MTILLVVGTDSVITNNLRFPETPPVGIFGIVVINRDGADGKLERRSRFWLNLRIIS